MLTYALVLAIEIHKFFELRRTFDREEDILSILDRGRNYLTFDFELELFGENNGIVRHLYFF